MSTNKQENYLDELLNSVNADKSPEELEMLSLKSQLERMRTGSEDAFDSSPSFTEERFVREFEQELSDEAYRDYIAEFERELAGESEQPEGMYVNTMDDEPAPAKKNRKKPEDDPFFDMDGAVPEPDLSGTQEKDVSEPDLSIGLDDSPLDAFSEIVGEVNGEMGQEPQEQLPVTEDGEVDLSGNSKVDLMDILGSDDELSDLGDILSGEGDLGGEDDIANFAEKEMEQNQEEEPEEEDGKGRRKKRKRKKKEKKEKGDSGEGGEKTGFFAKLARLFFGPEEEKKDGDVILGLDGGSSALDLADENAQILSELDNESAKKKKKEEKERKKKEKKEQKEKEKKEKPPKPKKEKPPKPPKEPDNSPKLPKVPVILTFLMIGSMMILVLLGTRLNDYQLQIKNAVSDFRKGNYTEGLSLLKGRAIQSSDEQLYNQLQILAAVSSKMKNYEVFDAAGKPEMAFDSIVCAAGRYDVNMVAAREWECTQELDKLRKQIEQILEQKYKMSFNEAVGIYYAKNREEYTKELLTKLKELGMLSE